MKVDRFETQNFVIIVEILPQSVNVPARRKKKRVDNPGEFQSMRKHLPGRLVVHGLFRPSFRREGKMGEFRASRVIMESYCSLIEVNPYILLTN